MITIFTSPVVKKEKKNYLNPFSNLLSREEIEKMESDSLKYSFFSSGSIYSGCKILFFNTIRCDFDEVIYNPNFDMREFFSLYEFMKYSQKKDFKIKIIREIKTIPPTLSPHPIPFFDNKKELLEFYYHSLQLDREKCLKLITKRRNIKAKEKVLITGDFLFSHEIIDYILKKNYLISILNKNIFFLKSMGININIDDNNIKIIELIPPFSYLKKTTYTRKLTLESYYPGYLNENEKIRVENFLNK